MSAHGKVALNHFNAGQRASNGRALPCSLCNLANAARKNQLVICDGCNGVFHQLCHAPVIDDRVVGDGEADWFCSVCQPLKAAASSEAVLTNLVSGQRYAQEDKDEYLATLSHDALRALISAVSERYPQAAIFPSDLHQRLSLIKESRSIARREQAGSARSELHVSAVVQAENDGRHETSRGDDDHAPLNFLLPPLPKPMSPEPSSFHERQPTKPRKRRRMKLGPDTEDDFLPPYEDLIAEALAYINDPNGSSPQIIWRYLAE